MKKPASTSLDLDDLIGAAELAAAFRVSSRQARAVLDALGAEREKGRGYVLRDVLRVLYERRSDRRTAAKNLAGEDTRLRTAQATLREIEIEKELGNLVDAGVAQAEMTEMATTLLSALTALPTRVAGEFRNVIGLRAALEAGVLDVRRTVAAEVQRRTDALEAQARRLERKGR